MATATDIREELMALDNSYRDAMKDGDMRKLEELSADPCLVIGAQGASTVARSEIAGMNKATGYKLKSYRVDKSSVDCRELTPGVMQLTYKVHDQFEEKGKPGTSNAYDTSIWMRNGAKWECAVHAETMVQK